MPADTRPLPVPDLLPDLLGVLREATGPSHERLDGAFGSLDLARRDDLARFLRAHLMGLTPLFESFRRYVRDTLTLPCPDYPAMLRDDLAALGDEALTGSILPRPAAIDQTGADAGVAYVVAGSRLGLTVIRQRGYWGAAEGFRSSYMEDTGGHAAWKALVPRLRALRPDNPEGEAARAAALASFDTFARAFAVSAASEKAQQGTNG